MVGECLGENASGNRLGLGDAGDCHDANSGMEVTDVLHKLHHRLAAVHHRIHQHHCELSLQMIELDVVRMAGMDEHSTREGVVDAESHGFSATHQRHNQCLMLVEK